MKKGFTLIELLVVVLIIGILSAVALPQYTKAVEKSRIAEAVLTLSSLQKAADRFALAQSCDDGGCITWGPFLGDNGPNNGNFDIDYNHLDCSYNSGYGCASKHFSYSAVYADVWNISATRLSGDYTLTVRRIPFANGEWSKSCSSTTAKGAAICKIMSAEGW